VVLINGLFGYSGRRLEPLVSGGWGSGTLIFEGKKYPIEVEGLSVLHVDVSDHTASGTVYNLPRVSDIDESISLSPLEQR
jgi:hypothetical protein